MLLKVFKDNSNDVQSRNIVRVELNYPVSGYSLAKKVDSHWPKPARRPNLAGTSVLRFLYRYGTFDGYTGSQLHNSVYAAAGRVS